MRKKHNLLIGERTAEDIKIKIGTMLSVAGADDTGCQRTKPGNRTAEDRDRFFRGDREKRCERRPCRL